MTQIILPLNTQTTHSQSVGVVTTPPPDLLLPSVLGIFDANVSGDMDKFKASVSEEQQRDIGAVLARKPISVLNALGSFAVKFCELGSYCHWFGDRRFIVPLNAAVSGLGIVLCVAELVVGAVGLKRAHEFRSHFVYTPPPKNLEDAQQVMVWAAKVDRQAQKILKADPQNHAMAQIQKDCRALIGRCQRGQDLGQVEMQAFVYKLTQEMIHADLQYLDKVYLSADPAQREKLLARLGVGFVESAEKQLKGLLEELDQAVGLDSVGRPLQNTGMMTESEQQEIGGDVDMDRLADSLERAGQFLELMHIQVDKKSIGHAIAMVGATIILAGLILGFTVLCPWWIPVLLLLVGSIIGVGHFFYWAAYGNSEGWNPELGKWFEDQKVQILKTLHVVQKVLGDILKEGSIPSFILPLSMDSLMMNGQSSFF